MHKYILFLFLLSITFSAKAQNTAFSVVPLPPGKSIYIPKDLQGMDLQNPSSRWSYHRMAYTENFVIFWEKGFGNDLGNPPQLEGHSMKVDLPGLKEKLENFYAYFYHTLQFARQGSKCDKYRMMVMINYSLEGTAYGGDYDGQIGALWIAPKNCPENYGFNAVPLSLPQPGSVVEVEFRGEAGRKGYNSVHPERAGWRYGFVAVTLEGKSVYGETGNDTEGVIRYVAPKDGTLTHLWLVVMGAPTEHWMNPGYGKEDAQWPYKIKITGSSPLTQ